MKIAEINQYNTSFGRSMNAGEMKVYTSSVNEGLRLLNKQLDIIIHNSAAPSIQREDIGIGTLFSETVQKKLIPFLKAHGFSGIQQEPNNLRKPGDPSPYAPESSAKNIFMIPLEKLTTEKYEQILQLSSYLQLVYNNVRNTNKVNYENVSKIYDTALKNAYFSFKTKDVMRHSFADFKKKNGAELEKAAIYRILEQKYNKNWTEWKGIDKNLYSPRNEEEAQAASRRIAELKQAHRDDIDYFMFQQFLIDLENKDSNELAKQTGVKIIGDSPVATPAADEWINQNLFLKGKAIGCPPDYFSKDGQRWGFGYFNPKYIFNPDGTLGKAGKILKAKYDSFFSSFPGGLRIDHVIGLVDPFIYTVKSAKMTPENSGRIYSIEGDFKKKQEEYSNILEKIVLQSAKEHGFDKTDIICEDLGDPNFPTQKVMKDLDLSGISVTQFDYRGKNTPEKNVIMIGSHDNISFLEYTDNLFKNGRDKNIFIKGISYLAHKLNIKSLINKDIVHFLTKTKLLAEDTAPSDASREEIDELRKQIRKDKKKFIEASFTELFTSPAKRVQIFFSDFWGLGKTYNRPGTSEGNWELRIPSEFEEYYYQAVSEGKAPNLAKSIAAALRQRGLDKDNPELMKNLDESADVLAEP